MNKEKINNSIEIKDKIYKSIRTDIIAHRLKPGESVSEEEFAHRYEVSRTPIREILRKLEQEELVTIIPNKGIVIKELSFKDIEEVLDIRIILETFATKAAAEKITSEQIKILDEIENQMDSAVRNQDSVASFAADEKLHALIWKIANNSRLSRIIQNLMGQILRIRFISGHKPGRIITTVEEHKQIIAALRKKDGIEAEQKMRIHLENTKDILLPSKDMDAKFEILLNNLPSF